VAELGKVSANCQKLDALGRCCPKPLSRMAALVRGDDEQILFMLRESYGSHAA